MESQDFRDQTKKRYSTTFKITVALLISTLLILAAVLAAVLFWPERTKVIVLSENPETNVNSGKSSFEGSPEKSSLYLVDNEKSKDRKLPQEKDDSSILEYTSTKKAEEKTPSTDPTPTGHPDHPDEVNVKQEYANMEHKAVLPEEVTTEETSKDTETYAAVVYENLDKTSSSTEGAVSNSIAEEPDEIISKHLGALENDSQVIENPMVDTFPETGFKVTWKGSSSESTEDQETFPAFLEDNTETTTDGLSELDDDYYRYLEFVGYINPEFGLQIKDKGDTQYVKIITPTKTLKDTNNPKDGAVEQKGYVTDDIAFSNLQNVMKQVEDSMNQMSRMGYGPRMGNPFDLFPFNNRNMFQENNVLFPQGFWLD